MNTSETPIADGIRKAAKEGLADAEIATLALDAVEHLEHTIHHAPHAHNCRWMPAIMLADLPEEHRASPSCNCWKSKIATPERRPTTCPACMSESSEMIPPDETGTGDWMCRMCWESDVGGTQKKEDQVTWGWLCDAHPHEAFDQDPQRFWNYIHSRFPGITRQRMEQALNETRGKEPSTHSPEEVTRAIETIQRVAPPSPPSDRIGKLVAHDTGDGWALSVMAGGEQIAIVEWPEQWTHIRTPFDMKQSGFEVRP